MYNTLVEGPRTRVVQPSVGNCLNMKKYTLVRNMDIIDLLNIPLVLKHKISFQFKGGGFDGLWVVRPLWFSCSPSVMLLCLSRVSVV